MDDQPNTAERALPEDSWRESSADEAARRMHIAYIVNQYPKVSHTFIRQEIAALEQQGVTVSRFAARGWNQSLVDARDVREKGNTRYFLRARPIEIIAALLAAAISRPVLFFRALRLALRMSAHSERSALIHLVYLCEACLFIRWAKEESVRHAHAHFGTNAAEVAMLAHVLGGPAWSFTVHGPEEFDKPLSIGLAEKLRRCSFVVAVSSYGRSQLFRLLPHDEWHKVAVIHCGPGEEFIRPQQIAPVSGKTFVSVGRLCEQKGQLLLIEAVRRLLAEGEQLELVLAGDGELRGEIEALVEKHGMQAAVRITGWLDGLSVREAILSSRAVVLPSFAEGLPVSIMEALALERPVISTFVAGIPELVSSENGWLVPAGDVDALAAAMRQCLRTEPSDLSKMGIAGRRAVLERHDLASECQLLLRQFAEHTSNAAISGPAQRQLPPVQARQ